jgi:hypothetical protein
MIDRTINHLAFGDPRRPRHRHVGHREVHRARRARAPGPPGGRHRRGRLERGRADAAGGVERLWREDAIAQLLADPSPAPLFISGCVANQGRFYPQFAVVVLLSVPEHVLLDRIASRTTNDFGKAEAERSRILRDLRTVEPLLRRGATTEIDTRRAVGEVADLIESAAGLL